MSYFGPFSVVCYVYSLERHGLRKLSTKPSSGDSSGGPSKGLPRCETKIRTTDLSSVCGRTEDLNRCGRDSVDSFYYLNCLGFIGGISIDMIKKEILIHSFFDVSLLDLVTQSLKTRVLGKYKIF